MSSAADGWPDAAIQREWRGRARAEARLWRLPLRSQHWRGPAGNWAGAGRGSSLEFQDHRPYLPGDDPRAINWQAYARSGVLSMKLYREEVSPAIDIVFDASASMLFEPAKRARGFELLFLALESALRSGAAVRLWLVSGATARRLDATDLGAFLSAPAPATGAFSLEPLPLRGGSLRVLISDCLHAAPPELLLRPLVGGRGCGIVLAPFAAAEAAPDWDGNLEFVDCESNLRRHQRVDAGRLAAYRAAYARHFALWQAACQRHGVRFARVAADSRLREALRVEALSSGALEPWV